MVCTLCVSPLPPSPGPVPPFLTPPPSQVVNSVAAAFQRVVDTISETAAAMEEDAEDIPLSSIMAKTLKELEWVGGAACCLCTPSCLLCRSVALL